VWHASNDILLTRLVELLFHAEFRAHPDGVYEYKAGHWPKIDEFNYRTIRRLEKVLGYASFFFKAFIDMETRREWDCVFECVQLVYQGALSATAVDATTFLRGPKCKCVWGAEGGRVILEMISSRSKAGPKNCWIRSERISNAPDLLACLW